MLRMFDTSCAPPSVLDWRPNWKKFSELVYKFLSRFSLSFNSHENRVVNIDGI